MAATHTNPFARVPLALAIPALLLIVTFLLPLIPGVEAWSRQPALLYLPYFLLGAALLLGLAFTQTRIAFIAAYVAVGGLFLNFTAFGDPDPARCQATLLLAAIFVPCVTAMFFRLNEQGLLTSYGGTRALAVLVALLFLYLLPLSAGFARAVATSEPPTFHTVAGAVRLPGLGLVALAGALPFLLIPKKQESPRLGQVLTLALLAFAGGLNFQSSLWPAARAPAALGLFLTAGAFILIWAVLESAWWHMNVDELTELPSRRALRHRLRCLGDAYVLAVVDLDHFKAVNDTHGHLVGDQVLRFVAYQIAQHAGGTAYRYGGEEFVVVYENAPFEAVVKDLDNIRQTVAAKAFVLRGPERPTKKPRKPTAGAARDALPTIRITVSIGAAQPELNHPTPPDVLEAADQALYRAKESGRNCICQA